MSRVCRFGLLTTVLVVAACSEPISPTARAITITPRLATMRLGDSAQLAAVVRSLPGAPVTWVTSDDTVLTVSAAGLVRAVGPGTATISAVLWPARDTRSGARRFERIAVGDLHACGLSARSAYCWGWNDYGQIGDTAFENAATPRAVPGPSFVELAAGGWGTCGVTGAHATYCWGLNYFGQLGTYTDTVFHTPVPMAG